MCYCCTHGAWAHCPLDSHLKCVVSYFPTLMPEWVPTLSTMVKPMFSSEHISYLTSLLTLLYPPNKLLYKVKPTRQQISWVYSTSKVASVNWRYWTLLYSNMIIFKLLCGTKKKKSTIIILTINTQPTIKHISWFSVVKLWWAGERNCVI